MIIILNISTGAGGKKLSIDIYKDALLFWIVIKEK